MAQKQQENVLLSEKLRNSHQLTEERLRNADDRIASFEKEITASRSPFPRPSSCLIALDLQEPSHVLEATNGIHHPGSEIQSRGAPETEKCSVSSSSSCGNSRGDAGDLSESQEAIVSGRDEGK
jgi:hypothetical protein